MARKKNKQLVVGGSEDIIKASASRNLKAKKRGTEVTEVYTLPFDTSFDWRVTLFQILKDLSNEAILEIVENIKETDADIDWRGEEFVLAFAIETGLFRKLVDIMEQRGREQYDI